MLTWKSHQVNTSKGPEKLGLLQEANKYEYGKHPFLASVGGGIGSTLMNVPLTTTEMAIAEKTGRPDLIMRLQHQRSLGHDPSLPMQRERSSSKLISASGHVDPALSAMAKQVADMRTFCYPQLPAEKSGLRLTEF